MNSRGDGIDVAVSPQEPPETQNQTDQQLSTDLKPKVIEILSTTANGCLSELGYFPGFSQRLYAAEKRNVEWQIENTKLYEDNRHLSRTLAAHSELLKNLQLPEAARIKQVTEFNERIRSLREERADLIKKNEALFHGRVDHVEYEKLLQDYRQLVDVHRGVLREVEVLRGEIRRIMTPESKPPFSAPYTVTGQVQVGYPQSHKLIEPIHPIRKPESRMSGFDTISKKSQRATSGARINRKTQVNPYPPQQGPVGLTRWEPASQIFPGHPSSASPSPNIDPTNHHARPPVPLLIDTRNLSPSSPYSDFRADSFPTTQAFRPVGAGQLPTPESAHPQAQRYGSPVNDPSRSNTFAQLYHQQPFKTTATSTPSSLASALILPSSSDRTRQSSSPANLGPMTRSSPVLSSPASPQPVSSPSQQESAQPLPPSTTCSNSTPLDSAHEPAAILTSPITEVQPLSSSIAESVAPSSLETEMQPLNLKRSGSELGDQSWSSGQEPNKKAKISHDDGDRDPMVMVVNEIKPMTAVDDGEGRDDDNKEDSEEEDEDEIVELDADGLRLPDICVASIIEDDDDVEGQQNCRLCRARFDVHLTKVPPQPFVRATMDELLKHCMVEHPAAWETLRQAVPGGGNE